MKQPIFFFLIMVLGMYLIFKSFKVLFPLLIFFVLYSMISSAFRPKPNFPNTKNNQGEVIKDVEIRVIDEDKEPDEKKEP